MRKQRFEYVAEPVHHACGCIAGTRTLQIIDEIVDPKTGKSAVTKTTRTYCDRCGARLGEHDGCDE